MGTHTQTPRLGASVAKPPGRSNPARLFHAGAAVVLIVLVFLGFRQFFVHGRAYPDRELSPPIRTLLILHGVAMTGWMALLLVQSLLVAGGNRKLHMALGKLGAVLAAAMAVLGFRVGVEATRIAPPDALIWGVTFRQFMAVPIVSIAIFAAFVAAALALRRKPDAHRALMLLATLAIVPAGISRIDGLDALYAGTVWEAIFGPFFMTLVVGVAFVVVRSLLIGTLDRWLAAGVVVLVATSAGIMKLATSGAWEAVAGFLLG